MSERKPSVFISYSHKDEEWKDRLVQHLRVLGDESGFEVWDDRRIQGGADWKSEIERAIVSADVAVLLVSVDFMTSDFIKKEEVARLLRLREERRLTILPVIVSDCTWRGVGWLSAIQARPTDGAPLERMAKARRNTALARIAEEIDEVLAASKPSVPAPTSEAAREAPRRRVVGEPRIQRPADVAWRTFEFEVGRVDERGNVVERRRARNDGYVEDLGRGVALEMMAIPGGTFLMGSPEDEAERRPDEGPRHLVTVPPFFMGRFAVTQAQWRAIARQSAVNSSPSKFKGDSHPVEQVSWGDAAEFCARLSQRTGRAYRLPSEAEWERAARAGTDTPFHIGPTITPDLVNYDGRLPYGKAKKGEYRRRTTTVGLGAANAFGLFDVHGNVWEWTLDAWHADYVGAPADGRAWEEGGDPSRRVVRGGSWYGAAKYCRSACRHDGITVHLNVSVGFRVVCSVAQTR